MGRRTFIATLTGGLLATPLATEAQQAGKVYTIGVLTSAAGPSPRYSPIVTGALRDSGYEVGRNLVIESRYAAGDVARLPELAADLVRRKVDLILAFGPAESMAAAKATSTIPIVFLTPTPVELRLARSLARPGANLTGISVDTGPEVIGKLLELLKAIVPSLSRLAVLSDPDRLDRAFWDRAARDAVQALRVEAQMIPVHREGDLDAALATVVASRADAVLATADPAVLLNLKRITDFATKHRLPTAAYGRTIVDAGGLMSYGPNIGDLMRRTIFYVDRILKGANPADLPVEQPTKFELVINLKTAKALNLTIPPSLLQRADEVIDP
jgi:putative ABC transport system substrate-binding protein